MLWVTHLCILLQVAWEFPQCDPPSEDGQGLMLPQGPQVNQEGSSRITQGPKPINVNQVGG
jgi:hypothetical protein